MTWTSRPRCERRKGEGERDLPRPDQFLSRLAGSTAVVNASPRPPTLPSAPLPLSHYAHITQTNKSQAGIDWAPLRTALAAADFQAADDEHRARLIELAEPAALARGWVYFSEVKSMPAADLRVMDGLWRAASGGKFGFSAQREVREEEKRGEATAQASRLPDLTLSSLSLPHLSSPSS